MATPRLATLVYIAAVGATSVTDAWAAGAAPGSGVPGRAERVTSSASAALPDTVRKLIERAELCEHFAGEFNGDRSRRDREINAILTKNKCDRIPSEIQSLKAKHKGDAEIVRSLQRYE